MTPRWSSVVLEVVERHGHDEHDGHLMNCAEEETREGSVVPDTVWRFQACVQEAYTHCQHGRVLQLPNRPIVTAKDKT